MDDGIYSVETDDKYRLYIFVVAEKNNLLIV